MKTALLHSLQATVIILLLQFSGSALAFTIIELPPEADTPSGSLLDAVTFNTQIQPIVSAIQAHILDSRRKPKAGRSAQRANLLASNNYAATRSDSDFIKVSSHNQDDGGLDSLWLNSTFSSFSNDFSRTQYDGTMHMLLAGFDYTLSQKYVFGVAVSFETSNTDTRFNSGNEEIEGYSINPYFAYLISDTWSVDLSLGYGDFDTDQYRTNGALLLGPPPVIGTTIVDSKFSATRDFLSLNLSRSVNPGNWYVTSWLGFLLANKDQDNYIESDATAVDGLSLDIKRWSLGAETAYSHADSETYFGLIYEKDTDLDEISFATGEQPANDDDSLLVTLGWRYYGSDITANFEFNSRLGAEDIRENSISSTLRIDL